MWGRAGRIAVPMTAFLLMAGLASPALAAPAAGADPFQSVLNGRGHYLHRGAHGEADVNICSDSVAPGFAHCDAHVRTDLFGKGVRPAGVHTAGTVAGPNVIGAGGAYDPLYLQSAYSAPSGSNGAGQTVAIVDAYDAVNAEADLATYRSHFGLPACTTANGCFRKVNEHGGATPPAADAGWAQEISLDVDMVSALCPKCHILLVEASTASIGDLGTAVNEAVALGANVVSNSYGSGEWSAETSADAAYYDHPGVAIVASSGDNGFGVSYPAASPDVVAVGGTSLVQATNTGSRNATETVWSGAGSGCSLYEAKPAWQTDTGCSKRSVADVSAEADPYTGVWVYDSADTGNAGWDVFGGTSVAAPIVSAMYALAGNAASTDQPGSYPYADTAALNDVTSGSNGSCGGSYLCTAAVGYDGPTGLGTPNTAAALTAPGTGATPPPDPPLDPPSAPAPDFSISAAASGSPLRAGTSGKSTVTLTPLYGDTGTVNLSTTTTPSLGLTTSIAPHAVDLEIPPSTSTLALTAHTAGTYTVTITATQGALTHTTTVKVTVNDFSLDVSPAKASVVRGKPSRYTVTVTPGGSFTGAVTLSVSGLRAHDTVAYAHNPAPASGSQVVTITTSTKDARGTLSLRFTGANGTLSHSVVVSLVLL